MSASDPIIGKKLGDYIIVDMLGQGGMARVYRGLDKKLNRYAAVKVIDAQPVGEDQEEYRQRFQNEARAIARLNHPNIVGIYQFDQVGTLYYMAMSFIEGKDLRGVIKAHAKAGTRMTRDEILRVIRDIGDALDYAHSEGVIHRDIKPSNIMVTPAGKSILTDFGLALSVPEGTVGNTFGSAHYIAPEQAISSAHAVPQSDIYSLGIVLFEMLTNNVPFNDPSALAVAMKHLSDAPPPPSTIVSDVPAAVDEVVMRALDKDPKQRYPTGAAMAQALSAAFGVASPKPPARVAPAVGSTGDTLTQRSLVRPPVSAPLDDSPTVTDSRASASTRHEMLKRIESAQPAARRQRSLLMVGGALLVVAILVAALVVLGGGGNTSATPTPTENAVVIQPSATAVATEEPTTAPTERPTDMPTADSTATDVPTEKPTEVPTDSPTEAPTEKSTEAATAEPTDRPTEAPTTAPTEKPTDVPSATPTTAPTDVPTVEATPEVTAVVIATDTPVLLLWDEQSMTLLNRSTGNVDVSALTFVQTQSNGSALVFESQSWANGSRPVTALTPGDCFQVQRNDISDVDPLDVCNRRHAWSRVSFPRWFWLSNDPAATFEVRRGTTVLATCSLSQGQCALTP